MSVHYQFKSMKDSFTAKIDSSQISVGDLKKIISKQNKLASDKGLQLLHPESNKVYIDDTELIAKNSTVLVARLQVNEERKKHRKRCAAKSGVTTQKYVDNIGSWCNNTDLITMFEGSEKDAINAMIEQSTLMYHPSNWKDLPEDTHKGEAPPTYQCHNCLDYGHWIKDCPLGYGRYNRSATKVRKCTGIPKAFLIPVDGPDSLGAMRNCDGTFSRHTINHQHYSEKKAISSGSSDGTLLNKPEIIIPTSSTSECTAPLPVTSTEKNSAKNSNDTIQNAKFRNPGCHAKILSVPQHSNVDINAPKEWPDYPSKSNLARWAPYSQVTFEHPESAEFVGPPPDSVVTYFTPINEVYSHSTLSYQQVGNWLPTPSEADYPPMMSETCMQAARQLPNVSRNLQPNADYNYYHENNYQSHYGPPQSRDYNVCQQGQSYDEPQHYNTLDEFQQMSNCDGLSQQHFQHWKYEQHQGHDDESLHQYKRSDYRHF